MKQLMSSASGSLTKLASSKLRDELNERVDLSEAISIAWKIVRSYPVTRNLPDSYIGALASSLGSYPASVVRRAHLCPGGIPSEFSRLPSAAQIIAWCEANTEPLRRRVERDERVERQFVEREERAKERAQKHTPRGMAMTTAWLDRTDPAAAKLSGEAPRASEPLPGDTGRRYSYKEFLEWARAHGKPPRPIGRFENAPPIRRATQEEIAAARAKLIEQIGQAAFDAIPDAT